MGLAQQAPTAKMVESVCRVGWVVPVGLAGRVATVSREARGMAGVLVGRSLFLAMRFGTMARSMGPQVGQEGLEGLVQWVV
jgi:hypothetical protein